jgi:Copper binding proteins, plastocyanin/azurin family
MHTKANPSKPVTCFPWSRAIVVVSVLAVLAAAGCNGSSVPTAPPGGGGGGSSPFNLGPFGIGQSAQLTFAAAGTFGYHCIPHRAMGMVGTVQVDSNGADSTVVQLGALTFTPSTTHIKPGGHVRWVNASNATNHTVTSD